MAAEILPAATLDTAGITATLDVCDAELATTRLAVAEARVGLVATLDPDVSSRPWTAWCSAARVHPFNRRPHHLDVSVRTMTGAPLSRTGQPMRPASIARRLLCLSNFYNYGLGAKAVSYRPLANLRRPKVSDDSSTVGLDTAELVPLLDTADARPRRSTAPIPKPVAVRSIPC